VASGSDIRQWRQRFRVRSQELSDEIGITQAHLQRVEYGTLPLTEPIWHRFQMATMRFALREKRYEMCERNLMADVYILAQLGSGHLDKVLQETKDASVHSGRNSVRDRR
jgi:predicted transcriptional regulator